MPDILLLGLILFGVNMAILAFVKWRDRRQGK